MKSLLSEGIHRPAGAPLCETCVTLCLLQCDICVTDPPRMQAASACPPGASPPGGGGTAPFRPLSLAFASVTGASWVIVQKLFE
jgi:hypothetical protein